MEEVFKAMLEGKEIDTTIESEGKTYLCIKAY